MAHHEQLWCNEVFFNVCSRKTHHTEGNWSAGARLGSLKAYRGSEDVVEGAYSQEGSIHSPRLLLCCTSTSRLQEMLHRHNAC